MEKLKPVKSNENFKLLKNNVLYFDDHYLGTYADCAIDFYSKGVLITWQSPFNERLKDYLFYNNQGRLIFFTSTYNEDPYSGSRTKRYDIELAVCSDLIIGKIKDYDGDQFYIASDYSGNEYKDKSLANIEKEFTSNQKNEKTF